MHDVGSVVIAEIYLNQTEEIKTRAADTGSEKEKLHQLYNKKKLHILVKGEVEMKKAITCASRRTVFCIVALLAISACLGIVAVVLHRPRPAATGLSIRMNDQKIRLFDTPEEALSAAAEAPAAAEENRLRLSWEGGALTHNVQAYMRAASEGEQGLQTSPYAVVYNFTPKKTEDVMYLRDITDGEKADGTLIQLEFVSYSKKGVPSFRYAILPLE